MPLEREAHARGSRATEADPRIHSGDPRRVLPRRLRDTAMTEAQSAATICDKADPPARVPTMRQLQPRPWGLGWVGLGALAPAPPAKPPLPLVPEPLPPAPDAAPKLPETPKVGEPLALPLVEPLPEPKPEVVPAL